VAEEPTLIIQIPSGSAIERQLREQPPPAIAEHDVLVQDGPTDERGNLEALAGEVVFSVPGPQELARESDELQRVVRQAGTGTAPLVVLVEAAEEFEEEQLTAVVAAAQHAHRPVILRVIRPSES
jgi:hypothetical protein